MESKYNRDVTKIDVGHGEQSLEYDGHKNTNLIENSNNTDDGTEQRNTKLPTPITCPSHSCVNLFELDYDSNKQQQQQPATNTVNSLQITKKNLQTELQDKHQQHDKKLSTHAPGLPIEKGAFWLDPAILMSGKYLNHVAPERSYHQILHLICQDYTK